MHVNGSMEHRLAGNLNVSFDGVDGDALLVALPGRGGLHGQRVQFARRRRKPRAARHRSAAGMMQSATRFGLGRFTTGEEVDYAAGRVVEAVRKLRERIPV